MTKTTRTYGFRVRRERWAGCESVAIRILCREGEGESPINGRPDGEHEIWDAPRFAHGLQYEGLTMRLYASDFGYVHIRPFEFEDSHIVDWACAARMVKTFRRIQSGLDKADNPSEIGDYVEAVARALGCTWWAHEVERMTGWNYASGAWEWNKIRALKAEVRDEWKWLQEIATAERAREAA